MAIMRRAVGRATHREDFLDQPFAARRSPWLGLGLLGISVAATLAILIYFSAWAAADRVEARNTNGADGAGASETGEAFWEDGVLWACPLH